MYAVLGATGKVGGAAVRELRRRALPVRAVVRDGAKAAGLAEMGCEIAIAEFHDADALRRALEGAIGVHVILPMNPTAPDGMADASQITEAVATAIEHARPERVVAISDYGAHNTHGVGLTLIWNRMEQRFRALPTATTILRSAEHMEGWAGVMRAATQTGVVPLFHQPLTKAIPTVSAPDVGVIAAGILIDPAGEPGTMRVIHVEGPRRYTIAEIVAEIGRTIGRPVTGNEIPPDQWIERYMARGLSASYAQLVAEMVTANNAGRMDVEPGPSEVLRGTTPLAEVLAALSTRS